MADEYVGNPYDVKIPQLEPVTLPLDEIIRRAIRTAMFDVRVCVPCRISAIHGNQQVDLQPLFKAVYVGQSGPIDMPAIQNCPVSMPMGQNYSIKLPIAVGDTGYALFSDRSMEVWLASSGGIVDTMDSRTHDITDAIFVPGLVPFANQTADNTTDLVMTNKNSKFSMKQSGKFKLENTEAGQELIDLLDKLLETLISETFTLTMLGPQPFIASTIQKLTEIKTNLGDLKS